MSAPPSFSTVVTNYNYGRYLGEALASALGQDYPPGRMEVIVVDDGSTDGSRDVLRGFAGDPRLRILEQQNAGQAAAFMRGVAHASHDYVCLLDSDDLFRTDKLRILGERVAALGAGRDALFLCHDLQLHDERRAEAATGTWFQRMRLAGLPRLRVRDAQHVYPFAVPAGQVYGRSLLASILEGLPLSDWRRGADNPIAHAALLRTGVVEYVGEPLGSYRIHGENRLIEIDERGQLVNRPGTQAVLLARRPKLLWYLERSLDTLSLGVEERQERVAWLKRLGATLPVSSAFAAAPPAKLSFIVVCGAAGARGLAPTLEALARQTHPDCEVLVAAGDAGAASAAIAPFAAAHPALGWQVVADPAGGERAALAALGRASGQFVSLIECGDRPDRDFAERHLYMHHYLGAAMVTACDFRLDAGGDLAQEGGYGRRKLWPARRHERALQRPSKRSWWAFSPRSGNVVRRTALLQHFADHARARGLPPGVPLEWLLLHLAGALGGCIQFAECLTTLDLESAHPSGMHARDPGDARFLPRLPQPQAAAFLLGLASAHLEAFRGHFGGELRPFVRWALEVDAAGAIDARTLAGAGLHPEIAALLQEKS